MCNTCSFFFRITFLKILLTEYNNFLRNIISHNNLSKKKKFKVLTVTVEDNHLTNAITIAHVNHPPRFCNKQITNETKHAKKKKKKKKNH